MFADDCPGQNRNQFVASMLAFMNSRLCLDKIAIVLVEKGHTEAGNDSVYSLIKCATRTIEIFTLKKWYSAARGARKSKTPYIVQKMSVIEFIDFSEMMKTVKNMSADGDGKKVEWSLVKQ